MPAARALADDEPVTFDAHIKPLLRGRDRPFHAFAFDLWSDEDVREHADAICERIAKGSIPYDLRGVDI